MAKSGLADRDRMKELRQQGLVPLSGLAIRFLVVASLIAMVPMGAQWITSKISLALSRNLLSPEVVMHEFLLVYIQAISAPAGFVMLLVVVLSLGQTHMYFSSTKFRYQAARTWEKPRMMSRAAVFATGLMMSLMALYYSIHHVWRSVIVVDSDGMRTFTSAVRSWCLGVALVAGIFGCIALVVCRVWFRWVHRRHPGRNLKE